ncbi:putative RNA pseudouridine synthase [Alphaproteobacteria bacterium]|nr:putative RNA pseudouridine synthase [Alphaproteobacteria bacterium]GHS96582.1 putative RNA pseudouridine synthase [Alphaproteobacteria bacterium]
MPKIRIAKYLANQNLCSRRNAERLVQEGLIQVNQQIISSPVCFVDDSDVIFFAGRRVAPAQKDCRLWLYYKSVGEITTHKDPQHRKTVFESVAVQGLPRVISVGRLDINSEGLLLLTTDNALAHALEKPSTAWTRHYRVRVFGSFEKMQNIFQAKNKLFAIKKIALNRMVLENLVLENMRYAPVEIQWEKQDTFARNRSFAEPSESHKNFWCEVTLTEGKNREVRKILNFLGWQVNRLIRLRYGPYSLGDLAPGQVQEVPLPVL